MNSSNLKHEIFTIVSVTSGQTVSIYWLDEDFYCLTRIAGSRAFHDQFEPLCECFSHLIPIDLCVLLDYIFEITFGCSEFQSDLSNPRCFCLCRELFNESGKRVFPDMAIFLTLFDETASRSYNPQQDLTFFGVDFRV